jgi:hypothetical protein
MNVITVLRFQPSGWLDKKVVSVNPILVKNGFEAM